MSQTAEEQRIASDIKAGKAARQKELDRRAALKKAQEAANKRPAHIVA